MENTTFVVSQVITVQKHERQILGLRIQDLLVHVTIRHPMASAYEPHASQAPGVAALRGEESKFVRYLERDGRAVVPFAVETWGRLGLYVVCESLA